MGLEIDDERSWFERAAEDKPDELRDYYYALSDQDRIDFDFDWRIHGRPKQRTPLGDWHSWLCLAGRGWGKTRTGAEFIIDEARRIGDGGRAALVGATSSDVWDVMAHGESGIIARSHPNFMPWTYKNWVVWPNGFRAKAYTAEKPSRLRGPQHHVFWADELAAWRYPEAWDMLVFGLRLGAHPRGIITTTPRPTPEIKKLVEGIKTGDVVISSGSTYENEANLPSSFVADIEKRYEGTRLGDQEIWAILLEDTPGALWNRDQLRALRVEEAVDLRRIVVAIDPAVSTKDASAETGIIVVGVGKCMCKGKPEDHGFVLDDGSGMWTPLDWATKAIALYRKHRAHRMIAEVNNGGDLVISNVETIDNTVHPFPVSASDGKRTRAEPVAALYEQGRVHHVGVLAKLEDQMVTWSAMTKSERSPDRVDALVWGLSYLMVDRDGPALGSRPGIVPWTRRIAR